LESTKKWLIILEEYKALLSEENESRIDEYLKTTLFPAQDERNSLIIKQKREIQNYLAIRRYVISSMYLEIKSHDPYMVNAENRIFFDSHKEFLEQYETSVINEVDINDY